MKSIISVSILWPRVNEVVVEFKKVIKKLRELKEENAGVVDMD